MRQQEGPGARHQGSGESNRERLPKGIGEESGDGSVLGKQGQASQHCGCHDGAVSGIAMLPGQRQVLQPDGGIHRHDRQPMKILQTPGVIAQAGADIQIPPIDLDADFPDGNLTDNPPFFLRLIANPARIGRQSFRVQCPPKQCMGIQYHHAQVSGHSSVVGSRTSPR
jgi:hypothetical protein